MCKLALDRFCFVCGKYIFTKLVRNITESIGASYLAYSGFAIEHLDAKINLQHFQCNFAQMGHKPTHQSRYAIPHSGVVEKSNRPRNRLLFFHD